MELRNGALKDPVAPDGEARTFTGTLLEAAKTWDEIQERNLSEPGWRSAGFLEDPDSEADLEGWRKARLAWEQTPSGKEWIAWHDSLPPDLQDSSLLQRREHTLRPPVPRPFQFRMVNPP